MLPETSQITLSNPLEKENEVWAVCYPGRKGDDANKCTLTRDAFIVTRKAKSYRYPVNQIQSVYLEKRKLLLPLITGGVLSPLALLAIYENMFSPGILLPLFFGGLFLLYYGWSGAMAVNIQTPARVHFVFIPDDTIHVTRFIEFSNTLIRSFNETDGEFYFYIVISGKKSRQLSDMLNDQTEHILYTRKEIQELAASPASDEALVLTIAPLKLTQPVRLKTIAHKILFVTKSVHSSCILKTGSLKDFAGRV